MGNRLLMLLCGTLVCLMAACSDDEKEQPQTKETPKAVKEVVEVLEDVAPQASDFVEVLKRADLTGVTADKITVFAVKNKPADTRAEVGLDTVSVKRHVVVGNYRKEELTGGQELTSVGGEKLLVSKTGEEISVNGVVITGEAIPAGDSYIYIVSKVIPEREVAPILHHTTLKVWNLQGGTYRDNREPLEGVAVIAYNSSWESLGDSYVTNNLGEVTITHASDTIFYQLSKEGYQTFADLNGDDKVTSDELLTGQIVLIYSGDGDMTEECFMKKYKVNAGPDEKQIKLVWNNIVALFWEENRTLNQELSYGYNNFSYANISSRSDSYWQQAHDLIRYGCHVQDSIVASLDAGKWKSFTDSMTVEIGIAYADVYGYYNKALIWGGQNMQPTNDGNALVAYMDEALDRLSISHKGAIAAIGARVCLNQKNYHKAYEYCRSITDMNQYALLPAGSNVFASQSNKAVVWGGYADASSFSKGSYFHPIRYVEVLLMYAEAANELGNTGEAIAPLNQIMAAEGKPVIATGASTQEEIRDYIQKLFDEQLRNEALEYSTWRRWGISGSKLSNRPGYKSYNSLLPVPQSALIQYSSLQQNPGY